jgi:hypothetical protein
MLWMGMQTMQGLTNTGSVHQSKRTTASSCAKEVVVFQWGHVLTLLSHPLAIRFTMAMARWSLIAPTMPWPTILVAVNWTWFSLAAPLPAGRLLHLVDLATLMKSSKRSGQTQVPTHQAPFNGCPMQLPKLAHIRLGGITGYVHPGDTKGEGWVKLQCSCLGQWCLGFPGRATPRLGGMCQPAEQPC